MTPEQENLMLNNFNLVYMVANRFTGEGRLCGFQFNDLVSIGSIGLTKAAIQFNPTLGFKFSTYAVSLIKGNIICTLRDSRPGPHFSRNVYNLYRKIKLSGLQDKPISLIAKVVNRTELDVMDAIAYMTPSTRLNMPVTNLQSVSEPRELIDTLGVEDSYLWIEIRDFIGTLPAKLKWVVFQMLNETEQKDIAAKLKVSPQYVSQKLIGAIHKAWKKYSEEE